MARRLIVTVLLAGLCFTWLAVLPASALVAISGPVTDAADLLTAEEEAALTAQVTALNAGQRIEMAILTVPDLEGQSIEDYSFAVAQGKLGNADTNTGLLLLIAPTERAYRFEVGTGLEGTLNDAKVGRVGRQIIDPAFQAGDYAGGLTNTVTAIDQLTQGIEPPALKEPAVSLEMKLLLTWFVIYVTLAIVAAILRKRRKDHYADAVDGLATIVSLGSFGGRGGGGSGGSFGGGGGFGGGGDTGGW